MSAYYILSSVIFALGIVFLQQHGILRLTSKNSSSGLPEPPIVKATIPIIGHLIGLSRRKFEYYIDLSRKIKSPVFTLLLPGQKIYVVTSPDLIQAIQKQHKILNFTPIESKFAAAIVQPTREGIDVLNQNLGDKGEWGIHVDNRLGMRDGTAPGPQVDKMTREMIQELVTYLDRLTPTSKEKGNVNLYTWLRDNLTIATTNAVYGPHNPYKDPDMIKAFWVFEQNLMAIVLMPKWLSKRPADARDKVGIAFEHYFANDHHKEASLLTRNRWDAMAKNKVPWKDRCKFEVAGSLAFLVNTIPAAFWLLLRIYSTSGLLEKVRSELDAVVRVRIDPDTGGMIRGLDITTVKSSCPTLLSAYQETLRHHTMGMSVREVTEDTVLDGAYTLKKGAMIQMPMRVVHTDPAIWGTDADEFRPRRFMKGEKHTTATGTAPKDVCFRAFGGGKTLCPGRHFATNEVVAVVATFVSRLDMRPSRGQTWRMPTSYATSIASAVMVPDYDVDVEITRRPCSEKDLWQISLTDSDLVLALTAEDRT